MTPEELKAFRLELGLSQAVMAKRLHRSRAQYIRYENGAVMDGAVEELAEQLAKFHAIESDDL